MDDCLFCKIVEGTIPSDVIYEDDYTLAFLDISPSSIGHTLVIPKVHVGNIYDMSDEIMCQVSNTVKKVATAMKKSLGADGINTITNNDADAGQIIFHSHTHIIPRYSGDGLRHWPKINCSEDDRVEAGEKIKKAL